MFGTKKPATPSHSEYERKKRAKNKDIRKESGERKGEKGERKRKLSGSSGRREGRWEKVE